jgi:hypothetical protein
MTYTYVPAGEGKPYTDDAVVVLATKRDTQKYENISNNPNVSLLVHDWVTARTLGQSGSGGSQANASGAPGLSQFLQQLNQAELSSVSATLDGHATLVKGDEAEFFRMKHLHRNSREARCFIEDAEIVLVRICSATVANLQNQVETYEVEK